MTSLRALLIDDAESDAVLCAAELKRNGFELTYTRVDNTERLREMLETQDWDIIFSDHVMPQMSGPQVIRMVKEIKPHVPLIILSGKIGEEKAVEALHAGAYDYVMKDNLARLAPAVRRALEESRLRRERAQVEAEFHQSQKMESVGRLAGGVAHDFNNILTVITGYTELLLARIGKVDPSYKDLQEIRNAAEQASTLTKQLLLFSRKQVARARVLKLNEVIERMKNMLQRLIGEDIELKTDLSPQLDNVKIDPVHIEQILMNLSVNARDAMPDGGQLTLRTASEELQTDAKHTLIKAGRYAVLSVTDTGCGMDVRVQAHLFEPFFTTKESGKGTGLGLATVYAIVRQSDGHLQVESSPGKGSTFKILLPATNAPVEVAPSVPATQAPESLEGKETVLVVEDEEVIRSLAHRVLTEKGYDVLEARHGEEALNLCEKFNHPIDLVLTDMIMPHMSGRQFVESFTKKQPRAKILFMSGYTDRMAEERELMKEGMNFLQKPFSPRDLVVRVRELLDAAKKAA